MRKELYAMTVINPINFPEELEIQIHPLSRESQSTLGGCFTMVPHRSWDWIRSHYPIQPGYLDEVEGYLKNGERANLVRGETVVEMPDDMEFPEKYKEAE